jgi:hypothetical protein
MWDIRGHAHRLCDGLSRRAWLRVGGVASLGLTWPALLRARAAAAAAPPDPSLGRARHCILLFPFGGPPQIDTFDPKPDAPEDIRGEFRPIATRVPGLRFTELFPRLAGRADRLAVVRSVTHGDAVHTSAGYTMLTGRRHPRANDPSVNGLIPPTPDDHPHYGAVLAAARPGPADLPPYVNLPEVVKDAAVNEVPGQGPGFLGGRVAPFLFAADTRRGTFRRPEAFDAPGLDAGRLGGRSALRDQLDRSLAAFESSGRLGVVDEHYQRAFDLLRSAAARRAFDPDAEPSARREAYGPHLFGQGCLMARRLVEAGVPLVTVFWHYEGPDDSPCWDTHENNARHLRERLAPPADRAFAALLDDLSERGLLDETLVVWMGEFGRSPRVNAKGGREHWPHCQSVVLAGGGIVGGQVYGASDRIAAYPADAPVAPADLGATILHGLGVDPGIILRDRAGRPERACEGSPLRALLG